MKPERRREGDARARRGGHGACESDWGVVLFLPLRHHQCLALQKTKNRVYAS